MKCSTPNDANGNPAMGNGYDVENRYIGTSSATYFYDPSGKRIWEGACCSGATTQKLHFYALGGQRIVTYTLASGTVTSSANVYFGAKLIRASGTTIATDRLSSVRGNSNGDRMAYYPYGEERTTTSDGREKFGTYFRDGTGLDYADQRYYQTSTGRFTSPDPSKNSAAIMNPGTWNRFLYVQGDPVNGFDPRGLQTCFYVNGELDSCEEDLDTISIPYCDELRSMSQACIQRTGAGGAGEVSGGGGGGGGGLVSCDPGVPCFSVTTVALAPGRITPHQVNVQTNSTGPVVPRTPSQVLGAAAPPMTPSDPNPYKPTDTYSGISASCMFQVGASGAWGNKVRGCLAAMYEHTPAHVSYDTVANEDHQFCYAIASQQTHQGGTGFIRAVIGAVMCGPNRFNPNAPINPNVYPIQ